MRIEGCQVVGSSSMFLSRWTSEVNNFFFWLKNENFIQTAIGIQLKSLNQASSTRGGRFLREKMAGSSN